MINVLILYIEKMKNKMIKNNIKIEGLILYIEKMKNKKIKNNIKIEGRIQNKQNKKELIDKYEKRISKYKNS